MRDTREVVHLWEFTPGSTMGKRMCDHEFVHIDDIPYAQLETPMDLCVVCDDMTPMFMKPEPKKNVVGQVAYASGWALMLAGVAFLGGTIATRGSFTMGIVSLIMIVLGVGSILAAGMSNASDS